MKRKVLKMTDNFDADFTASVIEHMNDDHSDAVVNYAKAFGQLPEGLDRDQLEQAQLVGIDKSGVMLGLVDASGKSVKLDIAYNQAGLPDRLESEDQVRSALVFMAKAARKIIAES